MLTRGALVAGSALVVLAWGCSSGSGTAAPTTTTEAPASSVPRTTTPPATLPTTTSSIPGPPLSSLILEHAPSGFERKPNTLADTGPTDLEKAVRDDPFSSEGDARRALVAAGFLQGFQRQWSTEPAVNQNFLYVYQFATPAGARSYLSHWRAAAVAGASRAAPVPFTPSLAGAIGLKALDPRRASGVVLFSKGPYAVQAVTTSSHRTDQAGESTALAYAEYALLP